MHLNKCRLTVNWLYWKGLNQHTAARKPKQFLVGFHRNYEVNLPRFQNSIA